MGPDSDNWRHTPDVVVAPTDKFSVNAAFARYVSRRQRSMIHAYAIIIATTLNTIRYSIWLSHVDW